MTLIVLDLDGTLVDTAPDLLDCTNAILSDEGLAPVTRADLADLVGQGARAMLDAAMTLRASPPTQDRLDTLVPRFIERYTEEMPGRSRPFEGAEAMMDALLGRGHRFAVCTNKLEGLARPLLDALGLSDRMNAICGPDTFDVRKPDPRHLRWTIERADGNSADAVMVGDSYNDIEVARRAGVPSIGVTFGYSREPIERLAPDAVIESLTEIDEALLARLLSSRR